MTSDSVRILGLMSGTSLDGIDLCLCNFWKQNGKYKYSIEAADTIDYPKDISDKLKNCHKFDLEQFLLFNNEYGTFCGNICNEFLLGKNRPYAIASHGHTIFHQPEKSFTYQIGSGACISAITGINTICDFRTSDIALGGQGAPLVPIGDKLLFQEFDFCLNIGGFANISFGSTAFDICAANFILNALCEKIGKPYDKGGEIARRSTVDLDILNKLNAIEFYSQSHPKSLGREWAEKTIFPILFCKENPQEILIATYTEHIAIQISEAIAKEKFGKKMIITGGGAHNTYLKERIMHHSKIDICEISTQIVDFKEALIFGFLGYLYLLGEPNCLAEITGAKRSNIGGTLYKVPTL